MPSAPVQLARRILQCGLLEVVITDRPGALQIELRARPGAVIHEPVVANVPAGFIVDVGARPAPEPRP